MLVDEANECVHDCSVIALERRPYTNISYIYILKRKSVVRSLLSGRFALVNKLKQIGSEISSFFRESFVLNYLHTNRRVQAY